MADHSAEIAEIEATLNAGVNRTANDGEVIEVDLEQLRKRLKELRAEDRSQRPRRPRVSRMNLGGF